MRPDNVHIHEIINGLRGTCSSIDNISQELYGEDFDWMTDLTIQELEQLDSEIFQCAQCGWWNEQPAEENEFGDWICTDCYEDK